MSVFKQNVREFLVEFKELMASGKFYLLGNRKINRETLIQLGITEHIRKECILNLSVFDYCQGPVPDENGSGHLWIFGTEIDRCEVYIKLKIENAEEGKIAKCLSFHIPDYPLHYFFSSKGRHEK